ncbi:MAG TPA: universal stress protein [Terriglobales bacterium]|jgi:two-component system sensor histidine kinase KdpD|nr:universal stress protein [Terriglobales bacterium]
MPKTPDQWLEECSPTKKGGRFKLFLGYAPGVGKTHTMLTEAIRRHSRGQDVVIGVVETHGRKGVGELVANLEVVPRKQIEYKGALFEEMDVDAILARKPCVALVDELAHTNIEGSKHRKRYEDVFELLDAGIDVLSTMNIQHLESVTPTVQGVTGITVRETVPDWVLQRVNEVVMIDLTPEALLNRMRRGDVYPQERVGRALDNFFRETNLIALRELALRQVAQVVDKSLEQHRDEEDKNKDHAAVAIRERIAVCISSNPAAQYLIARGARMAQALNAELFVVYIDLGQDSSEANQRTLAANKRFAENVGATVVRLEGKTVASAVAEFVNEKHITQVVFGRSATRGWKRYFYLSAIHQFLRDAPAVDVHIVTQER